MKSYRKISRQFGSVVPRYLGDHWCEKMGRHATKQCKRTAFWISRKEDGPTYRTYHCHNHRLKSDEMLGGYYFLYDDLDWPAAS
jgi:hypothetical protein